MKPHTIYLLLCLLLPWLVCAKILPIEGAARVVSAQQAAHEGACASAGSSGGGHRGRDRTIIRSTLISSSRGS